MSDNIRTALYDAVLLVPLWPTGPPTAEPMLAARWWENIVSPGTSS